MSFPDIKAQNSYRGSIGYQQTKHKIMCQLPSNKQIIPLPSKLTCKAKIDNTRWTGNGIPKAQGKSKEQNLKCTLDLFQ